MRLRPEKGKDDFRNIMHNLLGYVIFFCAHWECEFIWYGLCQCLLQHFLDKKREGNRRGEKIREKRGLLDLVNLAEHRFVRATTKT